MIKKLSDVEQIEHFTGSGLYDREFIEVLRRLDDPTPFLRGIVAELGYKRKEIPYVQPQRRAGKTHNNFYRLYDAAMLSITSYTKVGLRLATIFGSICAGISIAVAFVYLILKLLHWNDFPAGMAPVLIGHVLPGICADLLYRSGGRVYFVHQRQGDEAPSGGGGGAPEF